MPNIINDIKLDFKDVLLRPKRSTLKSRSDVSFYYSFLKFASFSNKQINFFNFKVDLFREITFRNSKQTYKGIPVMASNMDTVGTFEIAKALSKVNLFKFYLKYLSIIYKNINF